LKIQQYETWKPIILNNKTYYISNLGNVKSDITYIKTRLDKDGYTVFTAGKKNQRSVFRVHRLVAELFIPNPNNLPEVNHKDYDRSNCNVENLEWITHKNNIRYSICNRPDITGDNNPNYNNKKLSMFYKNNPEIALLKQSRKGVKNGRCVSISMYKDNKYIQNFEYIGLCCQYLIDNKITNSKIDSIRGGVWRSMNDDTSYKGYKFYKNKDVNKNS